MSRKSAVVIGYGMVGHRFVEALRARDESDDWSVTVLCEEPLPAYDRVGLSSYVGAWDPKELALAGNDYPDDALVDLRIGRRAATIDRESRKDLVTSGRELVMTSKAADTAWLRKLGGSLLSGASGTVNLEGRQDVSLLPLALTEDPIAIAVMMPNDRASGRDRTRSCS